MRKPFATSILFFVGLSACSSNAAETPCDGACDSAMSGEPSTHRKGGDAGQNAFGNAAGHAATATDASTPTHNPTSAPDAGCGATEFKIAELPPNVLILLDRSASMDGDAGNDTRWNVAKKAIETLTTTFDDRIRFGLATYSSCVKGGCSAGAIVVPIAAHNAQAIVGFLATTIDQRSSDGQTRTDDGEIEYLCDTGDPETSTGKSLAALAGEKSLLDANRDNAVVVLTDGEESDECANDCDGPCGAKKLLKQTPSVKTYAIGLGVNADAIDAIAKAGATAHAIGTKDESQLSAAFEQIAKAVASCDYSVDESAQDGGDLYVFLNNDPTPLPRDDADGWSFDAKAHRLRFVGSACKQIEAGSVHDIDVVFGCPKPTVD